MSKQVNHGYGRMHMAGIAVVLIICLLAGGCSLFPARPVYIEPGDMVELAKPQRFTGWITNAATGNRERRTVKAQAGWYVGRMGTDDE